MLEELAIYCADVGSIAAGNFAWASADDDDPDQAGYTDISTLAQAVNRDLADGRPVALGFESAQFIPVPEDPSKLGLARPNENPAWSSGPGANVMATGMAQAAWVLRAVKEAQRPAPKVFLEWKDFHTAGSGLMVWEAFVSGKGKKLAEKHASDHYADAKLACITLKERLPYPEPDLHCPEPYSLAGAALLWSGLSKDLNLLHKSTLVIRPGVF